MKIVKTNYVYFILFLLIIFYFEFDAMPVPAKSAQKLHFYYVTICQGHGYTCYTALKWPKQSVQL